MAFIAKNPLNAKEIENTPPSPMPGTRGLFVKEDGWYDINSNGTVRKLVTDVEISEFYAGEVTEADCDVTYTPGVYKVSNHQTDNYYTNEKSGLLIVGKTAYNNGTDGTEFAQILMIGSTIKFRTGFSMSGAPYWQAWETATSKFYVDQGITALQQGYIDPKIEELEYNLGQKPSIETVAGLFVSKESYETDKSAIEETYVKNTDYATNDVAGIVKVPTSGNGQGIILNANGSLQIAKAERADIVAKAAYNKPITCVDLDYAVEICTNQDSTATLTDAQLKLPVSAKYLNDVVSEITVAPLAYSTKTVIGNTVSANYVASEKHDLIIKLTSDTIADFSGIKVYRFGRNLFDKSSATLGKGTGKTGGLYDNANYMVSDYIPVTPNTMYAINWITHRWVACYDANKSYISNATLSLSPLGTNAHYDYINTVEGARYIRITADKVELDTLQIELGKLMSKYESYIEPQIGVSDGDGNVRGLTSVSPNMTFLSDADVNINVSFALDPSTNIAPNRKIDEEVRSINHRGFNSEAPENTLQAFKLSKQNGFKYVEADVEFTSDRIPVLLHDDTINRTARNTDGTELSTTINIADITYEEALAYDFGIWKDAKYAGTKIPTFEEFISLCKRLALHPYIETKNTMTETDAEMLVNIVDKYDMLRNVTWISFNAIALNHICKFDKWARIGYIMDPDSAWISDTTPIDTLKELRTPFNDVFADVLHSSYTTVLDELKELEIPLEVYTPNTQELILALDPYVTGVTSDRCIASKVMEENEMGVELKYSTQYEISDAIACLESRIASLEERLANIQNAEEASF